MKDLEIIYEDEKSIYLSCDKINDTKAYIEARDRLFNYVRISSIEENIVLEKESITDYDNFRVVYIKKINGKDVVLKRTNEINLSLSFFDVKNTIEVVAVDSYKGISLSLQTEELYDKYCVYESGEEGLTLILEGEDFQFTTSIFDKKKTYYAEAYKKENDQYKLANKTNEFKIKIKNFPPVKKDMLSVIIPTLNGKDFLPRTIDSVLLSQIKDYTIILLNDGSTDNTLEVMNWYKTKYPFISVVDKKWSGISDTRNVGVEHATGKFIAFLDGDDIVHPAMYKRLLNCALESGVDIAISKTYVLENQKDPEYILNVDLEGKEYLKYSYEKMYEEIRKNSYNNIYFTSVWNKVVKKEKAYLLKFPESNYYEDNAYTPTLYSYVDEFIIVDKTYYVWDKRKRATVGTYSTTYNSTSKVDLIEEYVKALAYPIKNGNQERIEYLVYHAVSLLSHYYEKINDRLDLRLKYSKLIDNYVGRENIKKNKLIEEDKHKFVDFLKDLV